MKFTRTLLVAALCLAVAHSVPVPNEESFKSQALDRLMVAESANDQALRDKRTIGILRQLFPDISKMIEDKVNMIVTEVIRVLGPVVLRSVLNQGGGAGGAGTGAGAGDTNSNDKGADDGTTVTVASPFDDDFFKDDNDDFASSVSNSGSRVVVALPTFPPDEDEDPPATDSSSTTKSSSDNNI